MPQVHGFDVMCTKGAKKLKMIGHLQRTTNNKDLQGQECGDGDNYKLC
jgi:hypothetical protein